MMATGQEYKPKILGFLCNWCCYAGADLCGVSRYQYPSNIRVIRVMCSGRVDAEHVIRAFEDGTDGVFIGGCWLGECHYITEGNYDALSMMHLTRKVLDQIGINPERLRLNWVSASEGIRFAEVVTDFTKTLTELGPLGTSEGLDGSGLKLRLKAVKKILPYLKLVERERLRVRFRTDEEYDTFFNSDEVNHLLHTVIADKLTISQITTLLEDNPLSTTEISNLIHLDPAEVSRHLNSSARQGLVRYDEVLKSYTVAY
jgi:coenzyme F420-reducing hydrogenase delta subunit